MAVAVLGLVGGAAAMAGGVVACATGAGCLLGAGAFAGGAAAGLASTHYLIHGENLE